jgi:hypothetical protein
MIEQFGDKEISVGGDGDCEFCIKALASRYSP